MHAPHIHQLEKMLSVISALLSIYAVVYGYRRVNGRTSWKSTTSTRPRRLLLEVDPGQGLREI